MVRLALALLISSFTLWAQDSSEPPSAPEPQPSSSQPSQSHTPDSGTPKKATPPPAPDLSPPHSDRIPAGALEEGSSSSKDTQVDLSPPADDAKTHPQGTDAVSDAEAAEAARGSADISEMRPWNPHRAAKDVEVGDFYFRRKNYAAAEDRYREALYFKNNDAVATYRLAVCLEKLNRPDEARQEYESYLKILPYGPEAKTAQKAIVRLKVTSDSKPPK